MASPIENSWELGLGTLPLQWVSSDYQSSRHARADARTSVAPELRLKESSLYDKGSSNTVSRSNHVWPRLD